MSTVVPISDMQTMIRAQKHLREFKILSGCDFQVDYLKGILEATTDLINSRAVESFKCERN